MKPRAYIFSGPTLAAALSHLTLPAGILLLPPAAQGDVYRAARNKPLAIGIVDGYFEGQASIWHKEILFAMTEGVHIFGSASMGALRAAELHPFGMRGIGKIFEAYRDGELEDDDEVAVLHAPDDAGFLPLSEPMVNIRATLREAAQHDVIDTETSARLVALAKSTFYQERSWPVLLANAAAQSPAVRGLADLEAWLQDHRIDQKEADALLMIQAMSLCLDETKPPTPANFHFEWTEAWDEVVRQANDVPGQWADFDDASSGASVLEEVRLAFSPEDPLFRLALLRHLTQGAPNARAQEPPDASAALKAFRQQHGLYRRADLDEWQECQDLDSAGLARLMTSTASIEAYLVDLGPQLGQHILDQLRLDGRYQDFAERALDKQSYLTSIGQTDPNPKDFSLSPTQLRAWYFQGRREEAMADDIETYARRLGFEDRLGFDQALRREFHYSRRAIEPKG